MRSHSATARRTTIRGRRAGFVRTLVPVLALCLIGGSLAACGSGSTGSDAKIKLTVGLFGDFGFKPLYDEYKKTHPNVEIEERVAEYAAHHTNLAQHIATNSGAADIEAVELGYIAQFTAQPNKFYNLLDSGAGAREADYLPWKWKQGLSKDGKSLIGLGTDVAGMAMCYRRDKFEAAGLPTDREAVSALWPTWDKYIEVGKTFAAKVSGSKFYDSSGNMFRAQVGQGSTGVYDTNDNLVVKSNPEIKQAWDTTAKAIDAKLSANITSFTPEWNTGFAQGTFATLVCPAWMTAYIEAQAKDAAGKWDIAKVPGGSGNMGGSHLVVPKQSKNPAAAAELIQFLLTSDNQIKVFKDKGNFPSMPKLYTDPAVSGFSKPFFNNAPIGKIFSEAALAVKPQYEGPRSGDVMNTIGQGLGRVEQGKQTSAEAWTQVLADLTKLQ